MKTNEIVQDKVQHSQEERIEIIRETRSEVVRTVIHLCKVIQIRWIFKYFFEPRHARM